MTPLRAGFLAAFLVLTVGSVGIHAAVAPLFGAIGGNGRTITLPVHARPTSTPVHPSPTATAVHRRRARVRRPDRPVATETPVPSATAIPTPRTVRRHHPRHRRRPVPTPTATTIPTATLTPTSGVVTLSNYWIGTVAARRGQTIAVGYTIDNETGRTERLLLGASVKPSRSLSWASQSYADTYHDIVATVPPGVTRHLRYFTLPAGAPAGSYDVAWGLRDAVSGQREALVFATAVLRVLR